MYPNLFIREIIYVSNLFKREILPLVLYSTSTVLYSTVPDVLDGFAGLGYYCEKIWLTMAIKRNPQHLFFKIHNIFYLLHCFLFRPASSEALSYSITVLYYY